MDSTTLDKIFKASFDVSHPLTEWVFPAQVLSGANRCPCRSSAANISTVVIFRVSAGNNRKRRRRCKGVGRRTNALPSLLSFAKTKPRQIAHASRGVARSVWLLYYRFAAAVNIRILVGERGRCSLIELLFSYFFAVFFLGLAIFVSFLGPVYLFK